MTKFSHVIIRRPGKSLSNGITSAPELGQPIYERAIEEHYDYEHALEQCGVDVSVLPALEQTAALSRIRPLSLAAAPSLPTPAPTVVMARRTKSSRSSVASLTTNMSSTSFPPARSTAATS